MKTPWFSVDKEGLAKILERKGKEFAVAELISNAWDQNVTTVNVTLQAIPNRRGVAELRVEDDDPDGFKDLTHAYTLFAESNKKGEAQKRGRFNLGEKLVLAVCDEAEILSTTGGVRFDKDGRHQVKERRHAGSEFYGIIRMNKEELDRCIEFATTLIPPLGIRTTINGFELNQRIPKATFEMPLDTHIADEDGMLKRSVRKTSVCVYEPLHGEIPSLYEMGIPVVETNDKWHIDILQKVPLSLDRDNVPPAYLRKVRAEVINHLFKEIKADDASTSWVKAATEAPEATPEAVEHVITEIFGDKRVIFDPSDQEANKRAISEGYSVIHPRSLSAGQWAHVKANKIALPAGQVTPSPKAIFENSEKDQSKFLPVNKWRPGMVLIGQYATALAAEIGIGDINVKMIVAATENYDGAYSQAKKELIFNVGRLGYAWFEDGIQEDVDKLIIHEFGHEYSGDHLSESFHDALCKIGAKIKDLALRKPEFFKQFRAVLQNTRLTR